MEAGYDCKAIEDRWMKRWAEARAWSAPDDPARDRKRYALTMFPYPSGDLHMGHVEIFSIHDAISRFARTRGHEVLNPIGWDAFGLPAENAAIKRGIHPKTWTYDNIAKHRASIERLGCSFDWDRVFFTCDPDFYRWNQWFFLRFYERGLAYRKAAAANWCPNDKTVLANEQVINGRCERCDAVVTKRWLTQWFFKITDYADRLLDDLDLCTGWTERLKTLQRNWIGRSSGAEVFFEVEGADEPVTVFTTRPDTLWGATFFVLAPEHPLATRLAEQTGRAAELDAFRAEVAALTEVDRTSTERPKKGLFLGAHARNPVNDERIPVWVADYVLMDYGTGAIMAVPAHDQRDFEFARAHGIDIRVVIEPEGGLDQAAMTEAYPGPGAMVRSGEFDGTSTDSSADRVTRWLEARGRGRAATGFRIRDWLISRQRYWGTPIPIIFCTACGEVPVPDTELPVVLPDDVNFTPTGETAPLATATEWVNVACPKCSGPARRETDTMDTFVDSSWYFLRYLDARNTQAPFDPDRARAWMPIDQYTGGITHAVMHLIYARFFQKVLMDMGMTDDIVEPADAFRLYGADALRLYMLFSGPPEQDFDWPMEGVTAIGRVTAPWLQRVWRLCESHRDVVAVGALQMGPADLALRRYLHRTIKVVTRDYEHFSFNTAIARLMELVNQTYRYVQVGGGHPGVIRELLEALLKMLAPMAPYIAAEQWARLGHDDFIHEQPWPSYDEDLASEQEVTMVVQIGGKVRDTIQVPADIGEEDMLARALASDKVRAHLGTNEPSKVIAKPPKLLSLVV
jgi:leucyl-tRNA synthetase